MKKASLLVFLLPIVALASKLEVSMENDEFYDDDSDYSHGTRISYTDNSGIRYGVQQQIYTPYKIANSWQVKGRHPYAGTLTGFIGLRDVHHASSWFTFYDDYELHLGGLGPSSHADDVQTVVHKLIGATRPQGWQYQLHDEAIVQTAYWRGYDIRVFGQEYGWTGHWVTEAGGLLGTLQISPGVNSELKIGYGFGSAEIDHEMAIREVRRPKVSVYMLGGCEGRWWLRNELLEGNAHYVHNHETWTVEMEPLTGCLKAGFGFDLWGVEARVLWLWWTKEYKTQKTTPNYMSMTLGWRF